MGCDVACYHTHQICILSDNPNNHSWGLYESALEFVGYPIVPGFDVAGVVERVGSEVTEFQVGDRVFGCTFFGAYSTRILIPAAQLRRIPPNLSTTQAASLPAVTLTALYALFLAGHFPTPSRFRHKGILIHSAAGGVGSMLVQLSRLLELSPIVGVVGRTSKVEAARALGCDVVIDKSQEDLWPRYGGPHRTDTPVSWNPMALIP